MQKFQFKKHKRQNMTAALVWVHESNEIILSQSYNLFENINVDVLTGKKY